MKQCGRCGAQNQDQLAVCSSCGEALPVGGQGLGGTMVMAAAAPPAAPPGEPEPPKAPANLRGTMIGIAPPVIAPPQAPAPTAETQPTPGPAPRQFAGTMIGMAPPSPHPTPDPVGSAAPATGSAAPRIASAQKTVLGVARPGIAPLNPGQVKAPTSQPPPALAPTPPPPTSWQPSPANLSAGPPSPRRGQQRISVTATLAIVGAAMLLVAAVVAFFMLRGHGAVTARPALDDAGNEQLELTCSECPDGTRTWIDTSPVSFKGGKATLRLQSPLKVGENPIVLVLERPGRSREEIALSLPIEFRVRSSTEELAQEAPKVSVLASALAGTKLEVDGKLVTPDPSAVTRFDYEVTDSVTGPEATVTTLERNIPYQATSPSGAKQSGQVQIRIGVTPLIIDAPGVSIVVSGKSVVLAGRTAPGATLKIGAQSVPLDAAGRFVSKQPLQPGDNHFVVRSTLKDLSPRLVKVRVKSSENLAQDAAQAKALVQSSYAEARSAGDGSIGRQLGLEGTLFDLRHDGYTSVLLIDVKGGCKKAPCLAKVLYGAETSIEKGSRVSAFGKVVRFVDGARAGERIPEVRADLVVEGKP